MGSRGTVQGRFLGSARHALQDTPHQLRAPLRRSERSAAPPDTRPPEKSGAHPSPLEVKASQGPSLGTLKAYRSPKAPTCRSPSGRVSGGSESSARSTSIGQDVTPTNADGRFPNQKVKEDHPRGRFRIHDVSPSHPRGRFPNQKINEIVHDDCCAILGNPKSTTPMILRIKRTEIRPPTSSSLTS